ncbi:MAG: carbon-nitrogen hydrolase family protein [Chthonomonadaceae bacterium]|nr:carbon-nitrogen hydrolase family protein [Chthonomonadaceae bacterium]
MKVSCAQLDVVFGDTDANLSKLSSVLQGPATQGNDLIVFPECFLTGYCVNSLEAAQEISLTYDPRQGAFTDLANLAKSNSTNMVVGFSQRVQDQIFNSAVLVRRDGTQELYQKTHLPFLGLDRFATPGPDINVFETDIGRIGVLICFDLRHSEPTRVLTLKGADIIVLPTNWPIGAEAGPKFMVSARAAENRVFYAACNRVGTESDFRFIGQSLICDVYGNELARAGEDECLISAQINVEEARSKRTIVQSGCYELDLMGSRRPELYGAIVS